MAPRMKIDRKLTYLGTEFDTERATFRPDSTGLYHALVACGLTEILAEGSDYRWGQLVSLITDVKSRRPYTSNNMASA